MKVIVTGKLLYDLRFARLVSWVLSSGSVLEG